MISKDSEEKELRTPKEKPTIKKENSEEIKNHREEIDKISEVEDITKELLLKELQKKADKNWDLVLRRQAEIENLKRRHELELKKAYKFGLENFVTELLQVWDSLELGIQAVYDKNTNIEKLSEGNELTLKLLNNIMKKFGVEQINPEGETFNPTVHQAMSLQHHNDVPPNKIITVVQKGYLLNKRLIRPAMVIVSQANS